jgi:hemolysin activation/secretion protein
MNTSRFAAGTAVKTPGSAPRAAVLAAGATLLTVLAAATVTATTVNTEPLPPATPAPEDGPAYQISRISVRYLRDNPLHPPMEEVMSLPIPLLMTDRGYIAPRPGYEPVFFTLESMSGDKTSTFYASAVQRILETIRDKMVASDLLGVFVAPDPEDIDSVGRDLRPVGRTALRLIVTTGTVTEVRTLGAGDRWKDRPQERINNPVHQRIIDDSPIQPQRPEQEVRSDLLRKDVLDGYLFRKSRHPGRRVDAALSASETIGGVTLDYFVTENPPLVLYAQVSNTGTAQTSRWRERFGFRHNQLTENDDILALDYMTANFDKSHALSAFYEAPLFGCDRLRWRVYAGWSQYTASDVGFFGSDFKGESWNVGAELTANIFQHRELFVDLVGGVRFQDIEVDNNLLLLKGQEDFLIPYVGLKMDRTTSWYSVQASAIAEFHSESLSSVDSAQIVALGRFDPSESWEVLKYGASGSVYLEPLLNWKAWSDPSTPGSSTLAHELYASVRGQWAFNNRLIPQEQMVAGGLYTVRGYPESVVAGDSVVIGTFEYRYHVPRAFAIEPEPRELFGRAFRHAPQQVYGRPDWDLILRAFIDAAATNISNPFSFESDETLIGVGVGIEFQYRRNLNVRLDWGFALEDVRGGLVKDGSNRLHFVATILF